MKVTRVEQFFPKPRVRLVKITTDDGLTGWGETTLEGRPRSTSGAVEEIADYLIGKDPLRIQHHWQHVYRSAFFRGGKWRAHEPPSRIDAFVECAYKMREWVGPTSNSASISTAR